MRLDDGRTVHVFDSGRHAQAAFTVLWHHGSPQTGALLEPVLRAAADRRIRLIGYARPSYGLSTAHPGRSVASAAHDVEQIVDDLEIDSLATMGASGGGPHALACAALLPGRVTAVACLAGIAPYPGRESASTNPTVADHWFDGMRSPDGLRSALGGRASRAAFAETEEFDETQFIDADWAALSGQWSPLGADAGAAGAQGPDGLIDDDVAFVTPWGFSVSSVAAPALFVQGALDRVVPRTHATWQAASAPGSELWVRPRDGHISVLAAVPVAMDWLRANADG